jgi:hypothetical protein
MFGATVMELAAALDASRQSAAATTTGPVLVRVRRAPGPVATAGGETR